MPHQKKERGAAISKDLISLQSFVNLPPKPQYQSIKIAKPKYIQNQQQKQSTAQNVRQALKSNQSKGSTDPSQYVQQPHRDHVTQSRENKFVAGNFVI